MGGAGGSHTDMCQPGRQLQAEICYNKQQSCALSRKTRGYLHLLQDPGQAPRYADISSSWSNKKLGTHSSGAATRVPK